jgi:ribosomal protein S27AE
MALAARAFERLLRKALVLRGDVARPIFERWQIRQFLACRTWPHFLVDFGIFSLYNTSVRYVQELKDRRLEYNRLWKERYPERILAHRQLAAAIKARTIKKPKNCQECGRRARINGHHTDYNKPLEVKWLCGKCHLAEHGMHV